MAKLQCENQKVIKQKPNKFKITELRYSNRAVTMGKKGVQKMSEKNFTRVQTRDLHT